MKRVISTFLSIALVLSCFGFAFATDNNEITLIDESIKGFYIVIPSRVKNIEKHCANLLCERLNTIYSVEAKLLSDNKEVQGNFISVGDTIFNKADFTDKKSGSYVIKAFDTGVSISGNGNRGLMDGVYRFLNEFCDYEVYTKDVISYTDSKILSIPKDINIEKSPFFEYRKVDTMSSYDSEYARANSLNTNAALPNDEGGHIYYITDFCHSLTAQFCNKDVYFKSHPEYFALHNGKRTSDQLCLTNPEVLKLVTKELFDVIALNHNPTSDLELVSISQADNENFCECEACKALDEKNGSHAGTMLTFVNAIAKEVEEAGYDNIAVNTLAYLYTRACPTNVVPRDNVTVTLCSIECCFGHTLDDESCKENADFLKDFNNWGKICDRIYIWDYVNNYSETFLPFANFQVLQRNMQIFYENSAKGIYEEGNYYMNSCNGEFYELRSYLLSKLMQNPYRDDYYELMNNYLLNVYGPGGAYIKEFIEFITKHSVTKTKHLHIRQQPKDCLPGVMPWEIRNVDKLWEKAKEASETDTQLYEIERSELCWQYWKCCRMKGEYSPFRGLYNYMNEHKKLYDKIVYFGNTALGEGAIKYLRGNSFSVYFLTPNIWESKYDGKFWHKLDPFADKVYEFLGSFQYKYKIA